MIQKRIFCEIAMSTNPGPGVWSYVAYEGSKRLFGNFKKFDVETSNRAKILAFLGTIEALERIGENVEDFEFMVNYKTLADAINDNWLGKWRSKGWVNSNKKPIENIDMWEKVICVTEKYSIKIKWDNKKSNRFKLPRTYSRKINNSRKGVV